LERYNYELKNYLSIKADFADSIKKRMPLEQTVPYEGNFLSRIPDSMKTRVLEIAESQARSTKLFTDVTAKTFEIYEDQLTNYWIELHRKFSLSFACLLLYLIGAPLGAIIRKGGIGLPLIVAVIFFVAYFIASKTGESLATTKDVSPALGMWMSSLILLPFAFIFIRAARNDSKMFSREWYTRNFSKLIRFISKKKNPQ
jgi:lipopolysaccharide export system permease protein